MASLTAHLLEMGDHGRLDFHPSCPVCRQDRLFGTLSSEPVISRRVQAALASGVLAVSAAAPGAAVATEPDLQPEGGVAPEGSAPGETDMPGFDPGGDTVLPLEMPSTPVPPADGGAPDPEDSAPLEREPAEDPESHTIPAPESEAPTAPGEGEAPSTAPPNTPPAVDVVPVPPADTETPTANELPERSSHQEDGRREDKATPAAPPWQSAAQPPSTAESAPAEPAPATVPAVVTATQGTAVRPTSRSVGRRLKRNARIFVVQSGDSLWSIAKRLLGPDATPAQVAREVARLWRLNEDRIGTGDPDLLAVGTKLRLR